MMRFHIGFLIFLLAAGPAFPGDDDSSESPAKKVERFDGSRTDTFEDSNGDGLNDSRKSESERKSPLKGLLDAIHDRISSDSRDDRKVAPPQPAQEKTKVQPSQPKAKKPQTDTETKTNRSGPGTR